MVWSRNRKRCHQGAYGADPAFNAHTAPDSIWMRNFEFGVMDMRPTTRPGRAVRSPQPSTEPRWPHPLPSPIPLPGLPAWGTSTDTRAHRAFEPYHLRVIIIAAMIGTLD